MCLCILQDLESECCEALNEKRGGVDFDLKPMDTYFGNMGVKNLKSLKKICEISQKLLRDLVKLFP